jgi:hypothetical protein
MVDQPARSQTPATDREDELARDATNLAGALRVLLDQIDYTNGACRMNELVGAAPREVINLCRERLLEHDRVQWWRR